MALIQSTKLSVFLWLWLVVPSLSFANAVYELSNISETEPLAPWLFYYEDVEGAKTITDVQVMPEVKWTRNNDRTPNYSYSDSVYWFRADLSNIGVDRLNGIAEVSNPLLNDIEFYFVKEGEISRYGVSGSRHTFRNRSLPHRSFLFQFELESKQQGTVYFRVKSQSSFQVPILVASEFKYFEYDQFDLSMKFAYYGMMAVIILFNLFLYFSLREPVYLVYITFIFGFAVQQFSMHGFVTEKIWPNHPEIQEYMVLFFMPFTMFFALEFTRRFLSLDRYSPRVNNFLKVYQIITIFIAALVFFADYALVGRTVAIAAVVVSLTCLIVGPYQWIKGQSIARYYSIAWICVAAGSALLALNKLGVVPRTGLTENGLLAGSAAEAILLSFALADRLNMERDRRFKAQRRMLLESENRKQAEKRLIHAALHHPITGYPNRLYFERWFDGDRNGIDIPKNFAFALIHLNRFHEINQTLGHGLADGLFTRVTQRLNAYMQQHDEFIPIEEVEHARYYTAVVESVYIGCLMDQSKVKSITHGLRDLLSCLSEPLEYQQMFIDVSGTAGWVDFVPNQHDGAALIRSALIAADVGSRRNVSVTEYSDDINPYSARRLTLAGELRKALEENALQLYFQPQLSVKENQYTSMESLLRWFHPEYGFMPPDEFIPIAEQSGIINLLTRWVVHESLKSIAKLHGIGYEISVSVNISAVNLRDRKFSLMIENALSEHQIDAQYLVLEVTETAMMDDPELALSVLNDLSELGIIISIDDFGTGHSSLAYIKKLPVHEIKIDRSFVMDMDCSNDDAIIVNTTLNMCHDLGLEVVAEGVENDVIGNRLKEMKCDYLQGYGLCRPIPFDEVKTFLSENA